MLDGLLTMRDVSLPNFALTLGELASNVVDQLNAAHNDNSSVPPQTVFTGRNTGLLAADAHGFTGAVTFAALDSNYDYDTRVVVDFDAGTIDNGGGPVALGGATLADLLGALNGANGFNGAAMLTLTNGVLSFAVSTASGAAMIQDATNPSDRGGRAFSHFFGLNDLMTADGETHYDTGFTTGSSHGLTAGGIATIQIRGPENQIAVAFDLEVNNLGGATWNDVLAELNANLSSYATFSLDSNGALVTTPVSPYTYYDVVVSNDTTARGATQVTFSDLFGVGPRYQMRAAENVQVVTAIAQEPVNIALSQLDESAAAIAGTVPALTPGDNRGVIALHAIEGFSITFKAAGNLAAATGSLSEYSGNVLSSIANQGARAEQFWEDRVAYSEALQSRMTDMSGVNLDEELANMLTYQNAYSASARIITTVQQMFDALLAAV